ncbi:hypothetical protein ACLD0W_12565 [Alloalcanivorax sp. C16-1]|uniref:hypothetical protein n=1 Tax=Alloalcanivorax sp. C16-1 TaxID=3390051 RepID=UPI003970E3B7
MTVQTLLDTISSAELTEWVAHFNFDALEKRIRQEQMSDDERVQAARAMFAKVRKKRVSR